MAKSCLVDFQGNVQEIVDPGNEFEIYEGPDATVRWVNCDSDDVNDTWILHQGTWEQNVQAPPSYEVLRRGAYGDVGEQLDMLYKDMVNGTTNWQDHIAAVKAIVPGPTSEEAIEMNASRVEINWGEINSPAWTTEINDEVPGLLITVGIRHSVIDTSE